MQGYGDAETGYRVTAADLVDEDRVMANLVRLQIVATLGILLALGVVVWWVIRLGVRPVLRMSEAAERIAEARLDERVPFLAGSSEAGQLATSLNTMLERIESAVAERDRTEAQAIRVGRLVDDLLILARLDQSPQIHNGNLDFSAIVNDAVSDIAAVQPDREVRSVVDEPVIVHGDDDRLRQAVGNIIGNAPIHTPEDTPIEVSLTCEGGTATLVVADNGPGMSPEDLERATKRFDWADKARTRARGGSGLGLSITHSAVEVHGGALRLDSQLGSGTTVTVRLPLVGASDRPEAS
ncbi:MAG: two-component system OmpR family sensor kinase [Candidatus Poriferisodalaceae bacterium]